MALNWRRFWADFWVVTKRLKVLLLLYFGMAIWVSSSSWAQAWMCATYHLMANPSSNVVTLLDTGSMEPTLDTRDVIIIAPVRPTDYEVGDIISYRLPKRIADLAGVAGCVHRIVAKTPEGYITKGDNNDEADFWVVTPDLIRGRVVASYRT